MAATNIFYRIPNQKGTRVASIAGTKCTLDQFCNHIFDTEGLNRRDFIIASGTKVFRPSSCNLQSISLQNNTNVDILITLLGGKGGFGSLLRAIGAQIEKTTNRDACRDLSGRRLRDIKREDELKKLIELRAKLEEERKRRKQEKLEKLKKNNEISKTSASIQELVSIFDDHAFNKRRLELGDILDAAVEKGLIASKKRQMSEESEDERNKRAKPDHEASCSGGSEASTSSQSRDEDIHLPSTNEQIDLKKTDKRVANKNHKLAGRSLKKRDLWLGLEEDDLEDSCEDDDQGKNSSSAVVT